MYTLNVTNGKGSGDYYEGESISVEANAAPAGQVFYEWIGDIDALENANDSITTYTMPSVNSSLTATYENYINTSFHILSSCRTRVKVYPNPANEFVVFEFIEQASSIEITDLSGKVLIRESVSSGDMQVQVNVSELENGMYMFRVFDETKSQHQTGKIVIN